MRRSFPCLLWPCDIKAPDHVPSTVECLIGPLHAGGIDLHGRHQQRAQARVDGCHGARRGGETDSPAQRPIGIICRVGKRRLHAPGKPVAHLHEAHLHGATPAEAVLDRADIIAREIPQHAAPIAVIVPIALGTACEGQRDKPEYAASLIPVSPSLHRPSLCLHVVGSPMLVCRIEARHTTVRLR